MRDISFLTGTTALVKLDVTLTGYSTLPPGLPAVQPGVVRNRVTWIAIKQGGEWLIDFQQMTPLPPMPLNALARRKLFPCVATIGQCMMVQASPACSEKRRRVCPFMSPPCVRPDRRIRHTAGTTTVTRVSGLRGRAPRGHQACKREFQRAAAIVDEP